MRQRCAALAVGGRGRRRRGSATGAGAARRAFFCAIASSEIELQIGDALRVDRLLVLHGAQHVAHHVDRLEQQVGDAARDLHAIAAQLIEHRFARMRERCDFREAERRAAALDRMRDAENRVDQLRLGRADVELEQRRLHRIERFEALVEEGVVKLGEIERHDYLSTRCIVAMSCAGIERLDDPAGRARILAFALAVGASLQSSASGSGVCRYELSARSARISSMPSMTGMFTSDSTRSNADLRASSSASLAIGGLRHFETGARERDAHHVAHRRRIIHSENARHAAAPVESVGKRKQTR